MRSKNILLISALLLLTADISLANYDKTISIAIITDKTSDLSKSSMVSLLEVELSQKGGIQLLERAEIDKIMEEQRLSAVGLLDRNTAVKIGKLLRADAFLILSLESRIQDANDLIRVRFAETAHGLRLLDYFEQPENSKPNEAIERIVQKIESVLNKLKQPEEKLIPVGIVDIHRVELGEKYKIIERTLPTMLSVRLSLEPQIIMLEREDLKVLLDEKLRTEGEDSKFWNSAVLIDGYIQQNNGQLEMHLNLKQSEGTVLKSLIIPVEPNEPTIAINTAVTEIIHNLHDSPPSGRWNPELEAEQFYKKGQMLTNHKRYEEALPLFETAHALQPNNVYYTGALFTRIWDIRREIESIVSSNESITRWRENRLKENPDSIMAPLVLKDLGVCPYTDMEIVNMVSALVRQIRDGYEQGTLSTSRISNWADAIGCDPRSKLGYFTSNVSVITTQIKLMNRINRKIWVETYSDALIKQIIRKDYPQMNDLIRARLTWVSSDDPNELRANLKKSFIEFVMPVEYGGRIKSISDRTFIYEQAFVSLEFFSDEYLIELTDVNDILVSSESRKALLIKSYSSNKQEGEAQKEIAEYQEVQLLLKKLKNLDSFQDIQSKQALLSQIRSYVDYLEKPWARQFSFEKIIEIWEEMCNLLIEENDITNLAFLDPGSQTPQTNSSISFNSEQGQEWQLYLRYYLLLERIDSLLKNHTSDKNVSIALINIRNFQAEIRKAYPQLNITQTILNPPVTMILTQNDWLQKILFRPRTEIKTVISQGKMLWIVFRGIGGNSNTIKVFLAGIDLETKLLTAMWQAEVPCATNFPNLDGLSINKNISFLFIEGVGIIEFPGSQIKGHQYLDDPKIYSQENGLPSLSITSIAMNDGKLWVAYGVREQESGLGTYDPETEKWETVFCSTLKDRSAFSNGIPYRIDSMLFISHNKLLFNVSGNNFEPKGLWKLNTDTLGIEHILSVYVSISKDINDNIWLNSTSYNMKFDSDSEKITMIIWPGKHQLYGNTIKTISGLDKDIFFPESFVNKIRFGPYYVQGNLDLSTGALHNNKLWSRLGESQIIIAEKGKSFEEAQIIDNNILAGEPVHRFVSTPYGLIAIGEGVVGLIETEE